MILENLKSRNCEIFFIIFVITPINTENDR